MRSAFSAPMSIRFATRRPGAERRRISSAPELSPLRDLPPQRHVHSVALPDSEADAWTYVP